MLAAIATRALDEPDAGELRENDEPARQRFLRWFNECGLRDEAEPQELELLEASFSGLEQKARVNASWRMEGAAVLAWALGRAPLPSILLQCDIDETLSAVGLLRPREETALAEPRLRAQEELDLCSSLYLTLHWRLRQFFLQPERMNFVEFAAQCDWAEMRLDGLQMIDNDVAVNGVPLTQVEQGRLRELHSIVQERRLALEWLAGFESLYSDVTTDT